jgi:hypothetical protein
MSYVLAVQKNYLEIGSHRIGVYKLKTGAVYVACKDIAKVLEMRVDSFEAIAARKKIALDASLNAIPVECLDAIIHSLAKNKLAAINLVKMLKSSTFAELAVKAAAMSKDVSEQWLEYRQANKDIHAAFQNHCHGNLLPGGHVHDAMTQLVFGQTASEAKACNELIGLEPDCGLDYQSSSEGMKTIARMKLKFCTYRTGTWQQRVLRAYHDCVL